MHVGGCDVALLVMLVTTTAIASYDLGSPEQGAIGSAKPAVLESKPTGSWRHNIEMLIDAAAHDAELPDWYAEWLRDTAQAPSAYSVTTHCKPQDTVIALQDLRERVADLQTAKTELADALASQTRVPQVWFQNRRNQQCQIQSYKDNEKLLRKLVLELDTACANCSDEDRAQFCLRQKKRCFQPCDAAVQYSVQQLQQQFNECNSQCEQQAWVISRRPQDMPQAEVQKKLQENQQEMHVCQDRCESGPGRSFQASRSGQCTSMHCLEQHGKCLRGEPMLFF